MSQTSNHVTPSPGQHAYRVRTRASAAAAAFVVACVLGTSAVAHADEPSPSPTPAVTAVADEPTVAAALPSSGVMRVGDALRVTASVHNPSGTALSAGVAHVSIGQAPLASPEATVAWMTEGNDALALTGLAPAPVSVIAAEASTTLVLTAAATDAAIAALKPGTYPLTVTYSAGSATAKTRTVVTVRAAAASAVPTSVVVPITTAASADGLLSADDLQALTAPEGDLSQVLDGVGSAPETLLAIDPAIVASIRALGTSAPLSAQEWLSALDALPNERTALQFADADVTTQFAGGLAQPWQPRSLASAMDEKNFAPDTSVEPSPSPSPTESPSVAPTEPVGLPTTEQLTAVGEDLASWWPAEGNATEQVVTAAGTDRVVFTAAAHTGQAAGHLSIAGASVLSYNPGISEALSDAASADVQSDRSDLLALSNALVQFQATAAAGQPLFLAFERGTHWDADALRTTLAALSVGGVAQTVTASALLQMPATPAKLGATTADPERVAALAGMVADEKSLTTFASVLSTPDILLGRERARELSLLGAAWFGSDGFTAAVAEQRERTQTLLRSVEIIQPKNVTLVSSGSNIPMFVRNDLPFDVNVDIIAKPDDVRVTVTERTTVLAAARATTRTAVPVTAGISNGDVRISLELRSPTGELIDQAKYANVSVRADWEAIGLVVLGSLVALLLGLGTFRMIRRRRRNAASGTVDAPQPTRDEARAAYRAQSAPDEASTADARSDESSASAPEEESRG